MSLSGRLRPPSPVSVDVVIAAVAFGATVIGALRQGHSPWWLFALAVVTAMPLIWRRSFPIAVTAVTGAGTTALALLDLIGDLPYAQFVATYTYAALSPPVWRVAASLVTGVCVWASLWGEPLISVGIVGMAFVTAYSLGVGTRGRRDRIEMLEERARRLTEQEAAAAASERARIARDMHDILAHSVSLIAVQAEAGPVVVRDDPAKAEAIFDTIAQTAHGTLTQLRRTLGLLRDESSQPEAQSDVADLPGLATLVARTREAGLPTSIEERGMRRPIAPDMSAAAYRIVQESLTNAVRHAGSSAVRVRLDWSSDSLRVSVTDDGCGPADSPGGTVGHGLAGMRERAALHGGSLDAGRGPGGRGFMVVANLPLAEPVAEALAGPLALPPLARESGDA